MVQGTVAIRRVRFYLSLYISLTHSQVLPVRLFCAARNERSNPTSTNIGSTDTGCLEPSSLNRSTGVSTTRFLSKRTKPSGLVVQLYTVSFCHSIPLQSKF